MVKLLIKKSEFMGSFMYHKNMISIFKNSNRCDILISEYSNDNIKLEQTGKKRLIK